MIRLLPILMALAVAACDLPAPPPPEPKAVPKSGVTISGSARMGVVYREGGA